jgi:superfamily II DNA/RNA helicase
MLDMGFIEDIEFILSKIPRDRQTSLFSATIDEAVMKVCNKYMKNPQKFLSAKTRGLSVAELTSISSVFEHKRGRPSPAPLKIDPLT